MDGFLDLFTKHRNSIAVLLMLGVFFAFASLLLIFLELKVAGIVNVQLPQCPAGYAVGVLSILVCLLALAVARHEVGIPVVVSEKPTVEKSNSVSTAADISPPKNDDASSKPGAQSPIAPLKPVNMLIQASSVDDLAAFDRAHKEFLRTEENPEEKTHWDAWALYQRFSKFGQVESFNKLQEKVAEKGCNLYYVVWLASCYEFTTEPGKQKELFARFYRSAIDQDYAYLICEYAEVVEKTDGLKAARNILSSSVRQVTKRGSKARLLVAYAKLLQKLDEKTLAAAAYELAFSFSDAPGISRFSAGYEESKIDFEYLSLKNYNTHLRKEPDHAMALNNLGVHCGEFEMPGMSIDYFKRSAEKGETLAMANLALQYMSRGFFAEAKEILDKAKLDKEPHENVMTGYTQLQEKTNKEKEAWEKALKRGIDEQEFMRQYGAAALLETTANVSLAGQWLLSDSTVVSLTQDAAKVGGNWIDGENTVIFSAEISGRCFSFLAERKSKQAYSILGLGMEIDKGVGYLSEDGRQVTLFCPKRKDDPIGIYKRV